MSSPGRVLVWGRGRGAPISRWRGLGETQQILIDTVSAVGGSKRLSGDAVTRAISVAYAATFSKTNASISAVR